MGYGRPPVHRRFEKGICPNRKGRGKSKPKEMADVIDEVLAETVEYREDGQVQKVTKQELSIRKLFSEALRGNPESAAALLRLRAHAKNRRSPGPLVVRIVNDPEGDDDYREQWIKVDQGYR